MKLQLKNVRLAFPALFEAQTVNGEGEPAYSASFLYEPTSPNKKLMDDAIEAVGSEKWGAKWPAVKKELLGKDKTCQHDGDTKEQYDGFPGMLYVSARNKSRPTVIDRDKTPLTRGDGLPYGGCYVNANVEVWAQDNKYGKRINASLRGVQFYRDGESFSGGTPASADEFDDVSGDEDDLGS